MNCSGCHAGDFCDDDVNNGSFIILEKMPEGSKAGLDGAENHAGPKVMPAETLLLVRGVGWPGILNANAAKCCRTAPQLRERIKLPNT